MSTYSKSVGVHNVGSYQVSGVPFVFSATNATKTATLKYVTSEVQINTTGANCTVHFGDAGSTVYTLPTGLSTFRVKCKKIVVVAPAATTASVCVSLTNIPARHLEQHTQGDWGTVA
tara:strand:- start:92 stop:442 length:351 start_codon:yes stop_codon:yes gene_type:complete